MKIFRSFELLASIVVRRRMPFSITFVLTHRCNFSCSHCDIRSDTRAEMDTSKWRSALEALAGLGLSRASFSGGEVLLRKDLPDLLAHARSLGLFTSINTNAWLLPDRFREIRPHLDMLVVSLDGPRVVHDQRRGREGAFDRTLRMLRLARDEGIVTAAITVVDSETLPHIPTILDLASLHGFWAFFQPAYRTCFESEAGLAEGLTPDTLRVLAASLTQFRQRGYPLASSSSYLKRLAAGGPQGGCLDCRAGRYFASILPDGTFTPCHLRARDPGLPNGREFGFGEAWHRLPPSSKGPGCLIAPYQEQDALFRLEPGAIRQALRSLRPVPLRGRG